MKRIVLLLTVICFFFSAQAQTFNVQAGTSVSHFYWRLAPHTFRVFNENSPGYSFFVGMDYLERKYMNLSSNIGLIRKGGQMQLHVVNEAGEFTGLTNSRATLDYISINTLIELKHPINEKIIPFFSVGPRVDLLLVSSSQFTHLKDQDYLNNVNVGFIAGFGLKYNFIKSTIGIRFDHYTDINRVAKFTSPENEKVYEVDAKMFSLNLSFGYRF